MQPDVLGLDGWEFCFEVSLLAICRYTLPNTEPKIAMMQSIKGHDKLAPEDNRR
jgi:hypothetical protein